MRLIDRYIVILLFPVIVILAVAEAIYKGFSLSWKNSRVCDLLKINFIEVWDIYTHKIWNTEA